MATGPEDPSVVGALVQKYLDQCNNDLSSRCDEYLRRKRHTTLREALANKGANWLEKMIVAMPQGGEAVIAVMLECRVEVPSAFQHVNYLAQAIYRLRMNDFRKIVDRLLLYSPRRGPLMRQVHRLALALARESKNGLFELRFAITGEGLRNNERRYRRVVRIDARFDDCRIFHQFLAVVDSFDLEYEVSWDVLRGSLECLRDLQVTEESVNAHSLKNSHGFVASNAQYGDDRSCLVPIDVFVTTEEVKLREGWYSDMEEDDEQDGADDLDGLDAWAMDMTYEADEGTTTSMRNKLFFEFSEAATAATGVSLDLGGAVKLWDALQAVPDVTASKVLSMITAILPFAKPGDLFAKPYVIAMGLATLDNNHCPTYLQPLLDALEAARDKELHTPTAKAGRAVAVILERYDLYDSSKGIARPEDIKYFENAKEALHYYFARLETDSDTDRRDVLRLYRSLVDHRPVINARAAFRVFTEAALCERPLLSDAPKLREAIDASEIRSDEISYALKTILDGKASRPVYDLLEKLKLYDPKVKMVPYNEALKPSKKAIAIDKFCEATKATSEQAKRLYDTIGSDHGNGIRGMLGVEALRLFTKLAKDASLRGRGLANAGRIREAAEAALTKGTCGLSMACGRLLTTIETRDFADEDERERVLTVLKISHEIDFHWKTVAYAKYGDCIKKNHRGCVEALCVAAERVPLRLIDVDAANALFDLVGKRGHVLSTVTAALQLEPERVGNIFEDAKFVAKAMIQAGMKPGTAHYLKHFVDSLQNDESLQRRWLHAKGVHLDDVSVPTYDAVRDAFREAHLDKHRDEQAKRARTPASPFKPRKSARQRQSKKK